MPRAFVWFNIYSRPFWDIAEEGPHDRFDREATATGRSVWLALFPGTPRHCHFLVHGGGIAHLASEKLQFAGFAPVRNDSKQREFVPKEIQRVTR